jgi:hypothetical protein
LIPDAKAKSMTSSRMPSDRQLLEQLKDILLRDDRQELEALRHILDNREELEARVGPILEEQLELMRAHFPRQYEKAVERIIDARLKANQEELINILYPRLGKLVRKFIANEFKLLRERIDQQLRKSRFVFWRRNKAAGATADELIASLDAGAIQEVYVVSRESGLLLGSASAAETADKDMIAGMLTAIKAFAEDAFHRTDEELQSIQYGHYQLLIHNFYNYYIALAIAGAVSEAEKDQLTSDILDFAEKHLSGDLREPDASFYYILQQRLTASFIRSSIGSIRA